jgi:hypothetical protein
LIDYFIIFKILKDHEKEYYLSITSSSFPSHQSYVASTLSYEKMAFLDTSYKETLAIQDNLQPLQKVAPATVETVFPVTPHMTWDSFQRFFYEKSNQTIQQKANILLERGNIQFNEVKFLVEEQRNALVIKTRNCLSPFGKLYSEIIKPRSQLPTLDTMLKRKGTLEAVLESVGKSRASVNMFSSVFRILGSSTIVIQTFLSILKIQHALPKDRERIASQESGKLAAGTAGGIGGAWAGCALGATIASPSLVMPVIGEVTTSGACMAGGIVGGIGTSSLLSGVGGKISTKVYDRINMMLKKHHPDQEVL